MSDNAYLTQLKEEPGAMVVRPASPTDATLCQRELKALGYPAMPQGYLEFLHRANGIAWNGIELFGTDKVTDPESNYTLSDIVTENEKMTSRKELGERLLLGRSGGDIYCFDVMDGCFEILDRLDLARMESFQAFDDFFSCILDEHGLTD